MTTADWRDASLEERDRHLANLYVDVPDAQRAQKELEEHRRVGAIGPEANCLVVYGPSGTGKTTAIRRFVQRREAERGAGSVLVVEVPAACTQTSLAQTILQELGDEAFLHKKLSGTRYTRRIAELMPTMGIEMLVLDEFQHLINSNSKRLHADVADWVKMLLNRGGTPIALAGMEETVSIVGGHPQLRRRSAGAVQMRALDWRDAEERKTFRAILEYFDCNLPFPEKASLSGMDTAARLHYATGGLIGGVSNLLRRATRAAVAKELPTIDRTSLAEAEDRLHLSGAHGDDRWINAFRIERIDELEPDRSPV